MEKQQGTCISEEINTDTKCIMGGDCILACLESLCGRWSKRRSCALITRLFPVRGKCVCEVDELVSYLCACVFDIKRAATTVFKTNYEKDDKKDD